MRVTKLSTNLGLLALAGLSMLCAAGAEAATRGPADVPMAVPFGVTLVDVSGGGDEIARAGVLLRRLGDAHGNPVYTYDADGQSRSSCFDECAREFPPLLAPSNAVAFGEWSLVTRAEGRQWAYLGRPLYGYAGGSHSGSAGGGYADRGFAAMNDPGSRAPKAGWRLAVYDPEKNVPVPTDISLRCLEAGVGYGFVVAPTGMPIYILKSAPRVADDWIPVYAPSLALPVGDFSIIRRADGTRQWAYKGQRLFTFSGDYSPSDISGLAAQPDAQLALAYRLFMPSQVTINIFPARPPLLTTTKGLSVYTEARYHVQYGGRETRGGYHYSYAEAKAVGTDGCTAECARTWRPVAAPANAQSMGLWEVMTRSDGSRQWAYKGGALYSYVGDKAPGQINGNNRDVILYGDAKGRPMIVVGDGFSAGEQAKNLLPLSGANVLDTREYYVASSGAGFYWHVVPLQ